MPKAIVIPLLNPNEPEAQVAALHISEGQRVSKGDLICTLETTKSAADIVAEQDGFVAGLTCSAGDTLRAGEILCYLAEDPTWKPEPVPVISSASSPQGSPAARRRIYASPSRLCAWRRSAAWTWRACRKTAWSPRAWCAPCWSRSRPLSRLFPKSPFDPSAIVIYGGGGHGKALIDLLRLLNVYHIVGVH